MASDETKMDTTEADGGGDKAEEVTKESPQCTTSDNNKQSGPSDNGVAQSEKMEDDADANKNASLEDSAKAPTPSSSSATTDQLEQTEEKSEAPVEESAADKETVEFKIIYNKKKYDITFPLDDTVASLKSHVETLISVPPTMQKMMFKGKVKDEATLRDHKVTKGSKIMVVGSTVVDVMSMAAPDKKTLKEIEKKEAAAAKESYSKQKPHKTILEKHGKPDDVPQGIKGKKEPLPPHPISGMYNKSGGKVRLTFKLEADQLWIGTKERTEKLPMGSIKAVVNEPIEGQEEYHLMGLQLGPTEASRYWIYYVPAQYVDAIKDAVLGKFQYF